MSNLEKAEYIYVDHHSLVIECVSEISKAPLLSVDLEFDKNRFRYGFNLCLIQIFDGSQTYLIDPLAKDIDLSPIFSVLENPDIQKVVFSFGEDLRLLHTLGCFPKGLYDLQIAAGLLNFPPSSLASLIEQVLGFQISKNSQQSNWFQRPLTSDQLDYAVQDVIYLPEIYQLFNKDFDKKGTKNWIEQEMHHFESNNHEDASQNDLLKEKYKADLNEIEWHIFTKLMHIREAHAKKINRPPFHVSERRTITEIARNPQKISDWMTIASNHRSTKNSTFIQILEAETEAAIEEAKQLGLSTRRRAAKRPSKKEYEKWKATEMKVKYAKQHFFKPVQKCIDQEYGEYVKTMILNNRLIKDLVTGYHDNLLPYKENVILECANKLNLDSSPYLNIKMES